MLSVAVVRTLSEHQGVSLLTVAEKLQYDVLPMRRKKDWLAGRVAVKRALRRLLVKRLPQRSVALTDIEINSLPNGAPRYRLMKSLLANHLPEEKQFRISISHTLGIGVAAASDDWWVGIDIERVRQFEERLLNHFLTEKEKLYLEKQPREHHDCIATWLWSYKEAFLKALETGLAIHPRKIEIALDSRACARRILYQGKSHSVFSRKQKIDDGVYMVILTGSDILVSEDESKESVKI